MGPTEALRRCAAALALISVLGCESLEERMTLLDDKQPPKRLEAIAAMEAALLADEERVAEGETPSAEAKALRERLAALASLPDGDPDPQVRGECLAVLGRSSPWTDTEIFRTALSDPASRPVYEALVALRRRPDPRMAPAVVELLKTSTLLLTRLECIQVLRELEAPEAIPVLVDIVTDLMERNRTGMAAWLALCELSGQDFSSEDFLAWRKWYESYRSAGDPAAEQGSASGVGSTPASGKGAGGGAPPEKR